MGTRFGLKSLFYITFLFGSASLAARLVMDMPGLAVLATQFRHRPSAFGTQREAEPYDR